MIDQRFQARTWRQSIGIFFCFAVLAVVSAKLSVAQAPTFLPTVITYAGNHTIGYTGDGGPATAATLSKSVSGGTMDPAGNIYIADTDNNAIRKVDARTGVISTFAGSGGPGVLGGYSGDGGPASAAKLNQPQAVRYYQGGLWIADTNNNRIRRIDLTTGVIMTVVGGGATALKNSNNTTNLQALTITVPNPQDIVFDSLGDMYWSQAGGTSRVNVLNMATGVVHLFAGTGAAKGTGTNIGVADSTLTQPEKTDLNGPYGLAVDAQNNVYVDETANHVIRKITVGSIPTISTYAGIGISGSLFICGGATDSVGDGCPATAASFATVSHFSIDGNGTIYLADSSNNRVRVIPTSSNPTIGGVVTTLAGTGVLLTSSPDGGYPQGSGILNPWDAQILPNGDLLIAERGINSVRLLHLPGAFPQTASGMTSAPQTVLALTQAALGTFTLPNSTDYTGAALPVCTPGVGVTGTVCATTVSFAPTLPGLRTNALQFTDANGIAAAGLSGVGLAPAASLLPGLMSTVAGTGTTGADGDGGAATSATMNLPGAMAMDGQGNLYVADSTNNEVRKITPGGTITRVAGTGSVGSSGDGGAATSATLNAPGGVALDAAGNLYIGDTGNNKIRMVNAANGNISTIAGTGTAGYSGDQNNPLSATLNAPTQLAWAPSGILYVADTGNSAVRAIALNESLITTVAGTLNSGFNGDGGPGQAAQLQNPQGVVVDGANNVYIADTGNNRIRVVSKGYISTIAGQQGGGFIGDGTATTTELYAPAGLAVDAGGTVYVADTKNHRVRALSGGQIFTVAGSGTTGATGDGGTSALATINSPLGVALDPLGNLYIADTANNQIRSVNVSTNSLAFKISNPGEISQPQSTSLFNSGNLPLTLSSVTVPVGYTEQASATGKDCTSTPLTLVAGGSCNLNTMFSPSEVGDYNGNITLSDNAQSVATSTQNIAVKATSAFVYTAILVLPGAMTAGTAGSGPLTIKSPLEIYMGTVKFTSTDSQAVLPANYTFTTADAGSLTPTVTFRTAGPQCVTVTDTTDPAVVSTSCSQVTASAAAKIAVFSGNNQSANVSTPYVKRLIALVTDAYGNPVQKASVAFTIDAGAAAGGTFANGTTKDSEVTDLSGYTSATTITSSATIGTFTVTASLAGTNATATFNLTVVILGSFTIVPDSPTMGPLPPAVSKNQNLTIIPTGGFSAPITLSCTAPTGIACSLTPSVITFNNGVPTLRPSLTFQSQGGLRSAGAARGWPLIATGLLCVLAFRLRRRLGTLPAVVLALLTIGSVTGCTGEMYAPITPNGTYTVTVTGTAQTVSATTSVAYAIQK